MRAILITPDQDELVTEIELDGGLQSIYKALDCHLIDAIRLDDKGNVMYVDDEGYMSKDYFFTFGTYPAPLAGRGLIVGTDSEGETIGTDASLNFVKIIVDCLDLDQAYEKAKQADEMALKNAEKNKREGFETITISIAEIMETAWYSDRLTV